jgi:hypothetical protein
MATTIDNCATAAAWTVLKQEISEFIPEAVNNKPWTAFVEECIDTNWERLKHSFWDGPLWTYEEAKEWFMEDYNVDLGQVDWDLLKAWVQEKATAE